MFYRLERNLKVAAGMLALGGIGVAIASQVASASGPSCRKVHARVFLQAEETPTCGSVIGLCASGELHGSLSGRSSFIGTSFAPTADTPSTDVVVLTGDNRIETSGGVLLTKDAIVLRTTGNGEFGEIDQVVGGTGQWAGATGTLTGTGTFIDGVGEALLVGEVCTP
jgi:hypothetical protein